MRPQVFIPRTVWCIHSARADQKWYVRCPSRSGAKIFLCGPLGPKVPTSLGPFAGWEVDETELPPETEILQAIFFRADDPRNWRENTPDPIKVPAHGGESQVQPPNGAESAGPAGGSGGKRYRKG